jgi:hypothetical protein
MHSILSYVVVFSLLSQSLISWVERPLLSVPRPQSNSQVAPCNFFDDFSSNTGWPVFNYVNGDKFASAAVTNGEYQLKLCGYGYWLVNYTTSCANPRIEVDATLVQDVSPSGHKPSYGLTFGFIDNNTPYYDFRIYPNGDFQLTKRLAPKFEYVRLIEPTNTPYINQGLSANHVFVEIIGKRITVGVNGHVLGSVEDLDYRPGNAGVWGVAGGYTGEWAEFHYDNFKVSQSTGAYVGGKVTTLFNINHFDRTIPPLREMQVELLRDGNVISTTTTRGGDGSDAGYYSFAVDTLQAGNYRVRASLRQPPDSSAGIGGFEVRYVAPLFSDPIPYLESADFTLQTGTVVNQDIRFSGDSVQSGGASNLLFSDADWLDDLGVTYFYTQQVANFARTTLGLNNLGYVEVDAVDTLATTTHYSISSHKIVFPESDSKFSSKNAPQNREWHEYMHHAMAETLLTNIGTPSCKNHDGFLNDSTQDSWVEGWAVFWPLVMAKSIWGVSSANYSGIFTNLNNNLYTAWYSQTGSNSTIQREDAGVAALLYDLYDAEKSAADETTDKDSLALTVEQLKGLFLVKDVNNHYNQIENVYQLYQVLHNNLADTDKPKVDQIFESHGFFGDAGWTVANCVITPPEGNKILDSLEILGEGGRQSRQDVPEVSGANLLVNLVNQFGRLVPYDKLIVSITYQPPYDLYNSTFELAAEDSGLFHIEPPPIGLPATIEIRGSSPDSPVYSITNVDFWDAVANSNIEYVSEMTFTVETHAVFLPMITK